MTNSILSTYFRYHYRLYNIALSKKTRPCITYKQLTFIYFKIKVITSFCNTNYISSIKTKLYNKKSLTF